MAQGPSDTILVAIRITLRIRESKVRNPDPPDRRRFVLSECFYSFGCYGTGMRVIAASPLSCRAPKSKLSTISPRHDFGQGRCHGVDWGGHVHPTFFPEGVSEIESL